MSDNNKHILITDDDTRIRDLLTRYLTREGFYVSQAHNAFEAWQLSSKFDIDLMVLDIMMPQENGFSDGIDLAGRLRENGFDKPIIMLTAKTEASDRIAGLETGVDDYLPKPFEPRELLLRIQAILRRVQAQTSKTQSIRFGAYYFDQDRGQLKKGDEHIDLTSVETSLLTIFIGKPGYVFSRAELAGETEQDPDSRTIDVQITRLRRKIEPDPKSPRYIQTIRGQGYVFRPDYE